MLDGLKTSRGILYGLFFLIDTGNHLVNNLTTSVMAVDTFSISSVICTVASLVWDAMPEISVATTANPFSCLPALAASILAFSASRLVWEA